MPKKSKKSTRTSGGSNSLKEAKEYKKTFEELIAEDPLFYMDTYTFEFPNGDVYDGEFCAHASGLVWRQGKGAYTTSEGQIYSGQWDSDKLDETKEVEITYPDGTKYIGNLLKNKYSGSGIYQFEEKVSMMSNFVENIPTGDILLFDPNEKAWHGFAEKDESLLIPEHAFYRCIGKDLGKGRPRQQLDAKKSEGEISSKGSQKSDTSSTKGPRYRDIRDIEKQVFAKSRKTSADLQLGKEKSEWYQEYHNYVNTYGEIVNKAKNNGEMFLTAEEYEWYVGYKEFEKKYFAAINNYKNKLKKGLPDYKVFELIHSEEYRSRYKPVPVFYPKEASEDDCDSNCEC